MKFEIRTSGGRLPAALCCLTWFTLGACDTGPAGERGGSTLAPVGTSAAGTTAAEAMPAGATAEAGAGGRAAASTPTESAAGAAAAQAAGQGADPTADQDGTAPPAVIDSMDPLVDAGRGQVDGGGPATTNEEPVAEVPSSAVDAGMSLPAMPAAAGPSEDAMQGTGLDAGMGNGSADTDAQAAAADLGVGDGSDVVTIGDSWMSYAINGGGIEGALARKDKDYRNYAVAGTTLAGSIPGQYDRAKRQDPNISTVIMTAGGNDIMFTGACTTSAGCQEAVAALVESLNELWTTMANDGVKDVIYIQYADDAGTTPQGTRPDEPPPVAEICASGKIRCHSLETTELVMGRLVDGIHPTRAGCDSIAEGVLELMEAGGIRR